MQDSTTQSDHGVDIAIVGMAGRFPGARDLSRYWANLRDGVEGVRRFADAELEVPVPEDGGSPSWIKAGGVLDDVESFDASFFQIPPAEAAWMDPQHRLFLECAWHALEDAGCDPEAHRGAIAVYAGANLNTYLASRLSLLGGRDQGGLFQALLGNQADFLATRVAYKLNLRGEAITVQTSCSTSLVALHLACQSLLSGQCDLALAGGVSIRVPQRTGYVYEEGMITSPDGHCRAFDARARGTLPGNGVGLVVLKRAEEARRDRDRCYAIVKGSWINNDGRGKVGFTAPGVSGQVDVIARALAMAGVSADTIGLVEAHGTGTPLGDPIEVDALTQAYRRHTARVGYCALGSVKTNLGHLDNAAGIAGLIKVALSLTHAQIPPTLHFEQPNPALHLDTSPFFVNPTLREWPASDQPRRAGVSSFGIGGTNAHAILEEAPRVDAGVSHRSVHVVTLSAKTAPALARAATQLADHVSSQPDVSIADIALSGHVGRHAFAHRASVTCEDTAGLVEGLRRLASRDVAAAPAAIVRAPKVVFLLPGQGSQAPNMAADARRDEPVFREHLDAALEAAKALGVDLEPILFPPAGAEAAAATQLARPRCTLPALLAIEHALARLWMSWGVTPDALIGHSWGEYVAACLAGVFTLDEAMRIAVARGALLERLPAGAMLAAPLTWEALAADLPADVDLAAINGAARCVVSGRPDAIARCEAVLAQRRKPGARLDVPYAYHSRMVDGILDDLRRLLRAIPMRAPRIPYISNLTGTWIEPAQATDPDYWAAQMREPVRFADGVATLRALGQVVFLEAGPRQTLGAFVRQELGTQSTIVASAPLAREARADAQALATGVGRLWAAGVPIDWTAYHAHDRCRRVTLPGYPFERQRHWIDVAPRGAPSPPTQSLPAPPPAATAGATDDAAVAAVTDSAYTAASSSSSSPSSPRAASAATSRVPLDRTSLPHVFVAPRTPLERDLVEIWADVLGIDGIGVEDHFIDLGGDSLVATRVFLRVQESCAAQVSLADLLAAPTIAALATFIEGDEYCAIDVAIGDEVVTMRMSEADFKRYGLPEGARNFRLLRTGAAEA